MMRRSSTVPCFVSKQYARGVRIKIRVVSAVPSPRAMDGARAFLRHQNVLRAIFSGAQCELAESALVEFNGMVWLGRVTASDPPDLPPFGKAGHHQIVGPGFCSPPAFRAGARLAARRH